MAGWKSPRSLFVAEDELSSYVCVSFYSSGDRMLFVSPEQCDILLISSDQVSFQLFIGLMNSNLRFFRRRLFHRRISVFYLSNTKKWQDR